MSVRAVAIRANGFQDWRLRRRIVVFALSAPSHSGRVDGADGLLSLLRCTSADDLSLATRSQTE